MFSFALKCALICHAAIACGFQQRHFDDAAEIRYGLAQHGWISNP